MTQLTNAISALARERSRSRERGDRGWNNNRRRDRSWGSNSNNEDAGNGQGQSAENGSSNDQRRVHFRQQMPTIYRGYRRQESTTDYLLLGNSGALGDSELEDLIRAETTFDDVSDWSSRTP